MRKVIVRIYLKVYATIWPDIINDDITHCDLIKFIQCNAIEKNYISEYIYPTYKRSRAFCNLTSTFLAFSMEPPRIQNPTFSLYLLNLAKKKNKNKTNKNPYRYGIDPNNLANTIIKIFFKKSH